MSSQKKVQIRKQISKLPQSPGVYIFENSQGKVLYIGKAAYLRERVRSYFSSNNSYARPIDFAVSQIAKIKHKKTETVLEAFILEQKLIKKNQPKYNVLGKDDKSFAYLALTNEEFPRFEIKRGTDLEKIIPGFRSENFLNQEKKIKGSSYKRIYGPFTSKFQVETALKILRRIFPFHSLKQKTEKGCLDRQIGLCPAPYEGKISRQDYLKNIRGIEMVFAGKKKSLVKKMEKAMKEAAQKNDFEKAAKLRDQIFALKNIQDIALIQQKGDLRNEKNVKGKKLRIEGYDVSNISGKFTVAAMVVFEWNGKILEPLKGEYRKFKIRKSANQQNDTGALKEALERRFKHLEWPSPHLVLIDGGKGQLNVAKKIFQKHQFQIPILAVAKGPQRKKLELFFCSFSEKDKEGWEEFLKNKKNVALIRDEAHRFAISYHRKLRSLNFIKKDFF